MKANGGRLTAADFARYQCQWREPITTTYRGYQVITFPPPSSGGVHVAQMLNILEHFDLKALDETARLHVIAETMKLAFADRAHWLGDPDFAPVPRGLASKEYAEVLAKRINQTRAGPVPSHSEPPNWQTDLFQKHTTHFSVADAEGNWVACTATVNTSFGSKVVIPGTGVVLNNEMDDFSAQPGATNYFGLVGADANAIAPGKRPLSSMTPTIVVKDGSPIVAVGAAGGPKIITAVLLGLVNMLDLGMSLEAALAAPRIHHQGLPNQLMVEKRLPRIVQRALVAHGHKVAALRSLSVAHGVGVRADGRGFVGAADPRADGVAAGW
jgi:gamma-glutamyltranspeptidase/glutathione hydrolase